MSSFDWTTAIAECGTHLAGLGNLPPPAAQDRALEAIAVLSLMADTSIGHALIPDSTIPFLTVSRYSGRHDLVDDLLAQLTSAVAAPARGNFHQGFSPGDWLTDNGFDVLILRSVQHTPDDTGRAALFSIRRGARGICWTSSVASATATCASCSAATFPNSTSIAPGIPSIPIRSAGCSPTSMTATQPAPYG
jgi:hypothetical protein